MDDTTRAQLAESLISLAASYVPRPAQGSALDLDALWQRPEALRGYVDLVSRYLNSFVEEWSPADTVLVSPDTLRSQYGILPVTFIVGHQLGLRTAVWKELADPTWGRSGILGLQDEGARCVALQAVHDGATELRLARSVEKLKWRLRLYCLLVAPQDDVAGTEAVRKEMGVMLGEAVRFESLISPQRLAECLR